MNWYKTTQINEEEINEGEIKYSPDGSFFVLEKNTKRNEGPWRISYFNNEGRGYTHIDFPSYKDAKETFDYTAGSKIAPPKRPKIRGYLPPGKG